MGEKGSGKVFYYSFGEKKVGSPRNTKKQKDLIWSERSRRKEVPGSHLPD